jgi:hypothetical protein
MARSFFFWVVCPSCPSVNEQESKERPCGTRMPLAHTPLDMTCEQAISSGEFPVFSTFPVVCLHLRIPLRGLSKDLA